MSQHHTAALSFGAAGAVVQGLALGAMAVDRFGHEIRRERRAAASSVQELAFRLREAREDQAAAYATAASERQARIDLAVENRMLGDALADAQREIAVLKQAYAELAARR